MIKRLLVLGCVLGAIAALPASASAAPAVPFNCAVKGQLLPTASIINRGTITYGCSSTYLGTSPAICSGTITGTSTSGTCTQGMLTVVSCLFGGTFYTAPGAWKGALKVACGLTATPSLRVNCSGDGGGLISATGAISGTITGYCEIPGTA